ncbi:hypothetical protein FNH04_05785 [Streptomyces phyllanthi]|uniref:Magnesium transporter CorA n=1 Tax=Streptomyces phyllanthi TaxID=1803180 RepID=A0A5N8VZH1_9ACTN|nr:hypothetical protein [Streptomyces phyllanthi]
MAEFAHRDASEELQRYLRDVADHVSQTSERVDPVLLAPTLVGAIYGMNFDNIPELHWIFGYPFAISLMAAISGGIYIAFKRHNCL